ncbi:MAG: M15 family peptidase [Gammaproteobacteria bacterium]|nr:M15 family peptidase [Gammaproteobacteria bacterium]
MPAPFMFSALSQAKLGTCHPHLRTLFLEVIKHVDCTVLEGHRSVLDQDKAFHEGRSKLRGGSSKHNMTPSMAVDVAPYPIDWNDRDRFLLFVGFVKGVAAQLGIRIRCGADWDGDGTTTDQTFHDLPHFELI